MKSSTIVRGLAAVTGALAFYNCGDALESHDELVEARNTVEIYTQQGDNAAAAEWQEFADNLDGDNTDLIIAIGSVAATEVLLLVSLGLHVSERRSSGVRV